MPELLILNSTQSKSEAIERLAQEKGYRVKTCSLVEDALSWVDLRKLHALLVPFDTKIETQLKLADALWRKNPSAIFGLYTLEEISTDEKNAARLSGAEIFSGDAGLNHLGILLTTSANAKLHKMSIMVVEDLESPRDIICAYVEGLGDYVVEGKASAKEAMQTLEDEPEKFSCIMTDIRMPEIDGKEFINYIRKHPSLLHLPVIVLTAYGTMDTLVDCLKEGATGFLAKPPKKIDLLRELARAQRVVQGLASPRLATHEEAEALRNLLADKGFY
ncbi:MAG: response regulator [Bdellovibrionales bacterium]|nr:response regulator [Bdellovibrionales bacterium]